MNEQIKDTSLYRNIKDAISEDIIFASDYILDNIMNLLEPFITDQLKQQEELVKTSKQAQLAQKIIVPNWTEEDDVMVDSIISDTLQKADLDDEQINWLKNLKSNFHLIQNKILNNE